MPISKNGNYYEISKTWKATNAKSPSFIIPRKLCEQYKIEPGDYVTIEKVQDGLLIKRFDLGE